MSGVMINDKCTYYRELIRELRQLFPTASFSLEEKDYGATWLLMATRKDEQARKGVILESFRTVGGIPQMMTDDDGNQYMGIGPPYDNKPIGLFNDMQETEARETLIEELKKFCG